MILYVADDLYKEFLALCVKSGIQPFEAADEAMREWIKKKMITTETT